MTKRRSLSFPSQKDWWILQVALAPPCGLADLGMEKRPAQARVTRVRPVMAAPR